MVLSFKEQFKQPILDGTKLHTIRADLYRRWVKGRKIHFATGVRTPKYNQFYEGVCTHVQAIELNPHTRQILLEDEEGEMVQMDDAYHDIFARNDGFSDKEELWKWFSKPFEGVLIHWMDNYCVYRDTEY